MWRRVGSVLAGVLLGAVCVALAVFLHREGIILAGAWAGVIGLLGIPVAALGAWLAWPRGEDATDSPEKKSQISVQYNETSDHGTTFAVQDGKQTIYYKQSPDNIAGTDKQRGKGEGSDRESN
jgi:hypothetical protein